MIGPNTSWEAVGNVALVRAAARQLVEQAPGAGRAFDFVGRDDDPHAARKLVEIAQMIGMRVGEDAEFGPAHIDACAGDDGGEIVARGGCAVDDARIDARKTRGRLGKVFRGAETRRLAGVDENAVLRGFDVPGGAIEPAGDDPIRHHQGKAEAVFDLGELRRQRAMPGANAD
jgi:hypothetical protein